MTIYRYEVLSSDTVEAINKLLTRGWKPSREVPLGSTGTETSGASALVILERDDTQPVALAARLGRDIPLEQLSDVPLLADLTHEDLGELIGIADVRSVSSGDVIFDETSRDSCLCVILEGEIELRLTAAGSSGAEIMQIGARDVFGESSFFSRGPHAVEASAVTDARLLVIPRSGYDELLQASRRRHGNLPSMPQEFSASDYRKPTRGSAKSCSTKRTPESLKAGNGSAKAPVEAASMPIGSLGHDGLQVPLPPDSRQHPDGFHETAGDPGRWLAVNERCSVPTAGICSHSWKREMVPIYQAACAPLLNNFSKL